MYLCLQVLVKNKMINHAELDFLLRFPVQANATSPVDFLNNISWGGIKVIIIIIIIIIDVTARKERFANGSARMWMFTVVTRCGFLSRLRCADFHDTPFNVWRVVHSCPRFGVDNSSLVILNLVRNKRFLTQTV